VAIALGAWAFLSLTIESFIAPALFLFYIAELGDGEAKKLCAMKKTFLLMLVTVLLVTGNWPSVIAQVSIGDGDVLSADSGVSLQLDGTKGGLLLPQVEIADLTALPADFPDETDPDAVVGLLVYNKTAAVDGATDADIVVGVYYWSSTGWKLLG
jgi:hypothetical protein